MTALELRKYLEALPSDARITLRLAKKVLGKTTMVEYTELHEGMLRFREGTPVNGTYTEFPPELYIQHEIQF